MLDEKKFGKLLSIISHYALENLEDVIPYEKKSDEERDSIVKAALKSLEVSAVITLKFLDPNSFNEDLLDNIFLKLKDKKFDDANSIINNVK